MKQGDDEDTKPDSLFSLSDARSMVKAYFRPILVVVFSVLLSYYLNTRILQISTNIASIVQDTSTPLIAAFATIIFIFNARNLDIAIKIRACTSESLQLINEIRRLKSEGTPLEDLPHDYAKRRIRSLRQQVLVFRNRYSSNHNAITTIFFSMMLIVSCIIFIKSSPPQLPSHLLPSVIYIGGIIAAIIGFMLFGFTHVWRAKKTIDEEIEFHRRECKRFSKEMDALSNPNN